MWNGKCKAAPDETVVTEIDVNARNGGLGDSNSINSVSSGDVSAISSMATCCNSDATNPAAKRGRQFQLSQVSFVPILFFSNDSESIFVYFECKMSENIFKIKSQIRAANDFVDKLGNKLLWSTYYSRYVL